MNEQILKMMNDEYTLNEIASKLWLSPKMIHQIICEIMNDDYFIHPIYYDNGNIRYIFEDEDNINIFTTNSYFRALVISDLHFGSKQENLNYLYKVYDYAKDNNIHIIINCGDIIDGAFGKTLKNIYDIDKQIERVIQKYPYDKSILNFICLGNHDYNALECGYDISIIFKERFDLINLGYEESLINIENDQIIIRHPFKVSNDIFNSKLILEGHHHKMMLKAKENCFCVNVPSLSDLTFGNKRTPGFIDMNLFLNNGLISNGYFRQIGVNDGLSILSEICLDFNLEKPKIKSHNFE